MPIGISFTTSKFDVSKEDKNPINAIFGQSLLLWLKEKVAGTIELPTPDTEDWGWYTTTNCKGRSYLLGASAEEGGSYWVFQIDKHRSVKEILLGREKMTEDDECLQYFKSVPESEAAFKDIEFA